MRAPIVRVRETAGQPGRDDTAQARGGPPPWGRGDRSTTRSASGEQVPTCHSRVGAVPRPNS